MKRTEKLAWYKKEFEDISKEIKESDSLSYHYFLRIRNFKLQNSSPETNRRIADITKKAFQLAREDKIQEAITELIKLEGVAIPIASTILAMRFPDKFAIIDSRVIKKLGKIEWLKGYLNKPEIYGSYIALLRDMSKGQNKTLRDLERELFEA